MKPKLPLSRFPPKPTLASPLNAAKTELTARIAMLALPLNAAKTELTARIATRRIAIVFLIIPP